MGACLVWAMHTNRMNFDARDSMAGKGFGSIDI